MSKKRILIFASGRGSNAEAIHEATVDGRVNGTVVGVICDHADAQVLKEQNAGTFLPQYWNSNPLKTRQPSMMLFWKQPDPMTRTSSAWQDT